METLHITSFFVLPHISPVKAGLWDRSYTQTFIQMQKHKCRHTQEMLFSKHLSVILCKTIEKHLKYLLQHKVCCGCMFIPLFSFALAVQTAVFGQ